MRSVLLCGLILWPCVALGSAEPQTVVRHFFEAHASGEALDRFWADGAKDRETFERTARLAWRVHCLELQGVVSRTVQIDGNTAAVRVTLLLTKRERATGRARGPAAIDYDVVLTRDGEWRVTNVVPAAVGWADALIAATGPDARRALAAAAPEILSVDVDRALIRRAIAATNIPDLAEASRIAAIAGEIAEEIGDEGGISLRDSVRSIVARMETRPDDARAFATEAVDRARRNDDPDVLARALLSLARTWDSRAFGETYRGLLGEAAALEDRVEDLSLMVRVLVSLEVDAWDSDDYVSLRRYIDREVRMARFAGDRTGLAAALLNLANIYDQLADPLPCIEHARQSGEIYAEISPGQWFISTLLLEARCLDTIADFATARVRRDRALDLARQWKNEYQESFALIDLAHTSLRRGEDDLALAAARQAARLEQGPPLRNLVLAEALAKNRLFSEALEAALKFRDTPSAEGPSRRAATSAVIARALRGLGDRNGALAELRNSLEAAERLRELVPGDEQQVAAAFGEEVIRAYVEAVDLSVELGRLEEGLAFAERAKGRALLDTLRAGGKRLTKSMSADEAATEQQLETEIAAANRALAATEAGSGNPPSARDRLEHARNELASFRATLYAHHPRLKAQRGDVAIATVEEMARALPPGGALVEYAIGDERTIVFVLRRDAEGGAQLRARVLAIAAKALGDKVIAYREQLAARGLAGRKAAIDLDALLLVPIDDLLAGVRVLGIIPDGVLWQLPFETLIDVKGRYRVETATMFYAPSISVLLEVRKTRSSSPRTRESVLALGDPLLGAEVRRNLTAVYRGFDLSPMPEARVEVERLRAIYGRDNTAVYVGDAVTEARVKSEIAGRDVVHFATHGILDDASPMFSRLLLSEQAGAIGADSDGMLEAWELMKLDLRADLVVMSSCDSARGRVTAGEGMIGMAWAAFVAGARTTVASLWKVSSKSTSTLMVDFHRELRSRPAGPVVKAEALRRAKLRMLRNPEYRHPFYWAPFVVIGDPGR